MKKRGPTGLFLIRSKSTVRAAFASALSGMTLFAMLLIPVAPAAQAAPASDLLEPVAVVAEVQKTPLPSSRAKTRTVGAPQPSPPQVAKQVPTAPVAPPYTCFTAEYGMPARIDPATAASGVTIVQAAPTYYQFNAGTTHSDTVSRAIRCAQSQPALGSYHALTAYNVAWSYSKVATSKTACKLYNVRVTMRISQLLPYANTSQSSRTVAASWAAALAKLTAHENEHATVDRAGAEQLYQALSTMTGSCDSIDGLALQATSAATAQLRSKNVTLDAQSRHGLD